MSLTGLQLLSQSSLWPWLLDWWGQALKEFFFSELINFKNANLHIFGHHCFCQLWVLGEAYRSPSWDIHNFLSLLYDLNCWIIGNKPPKEVFFQSWLPSKMLICAILVSISKFWPSFELIRQRIHVPHRTSIALSVFTMTLTAGQMGASPSKILFS